MKQYKTIIGIDPDSSKSGIAVYDIREKEYTLLKTLPFFTLTNTIIAHSGDAIVLIEASWLLKGSWYPGGAAIAAKIGRAVGANHQIGRLLAEYCAVTNIPYELVIPTETKVKAGKFTAYTGYTGSTNPETRDAGILVHRWLKANNYL